MNLVNSGNASLCFLAMSHFPPSIWQLQSESRFFAHVSCPGCTTRLEGGNRVVFLPGHADKWDLCQAISAYRRHIRQHPEPENAQQLRLEAMHAQADGDFLRATVEVMAALDIIKRTT